MRGSFIATERAFRKRHWSRRAGFGRIDDKGQQMFKVGENHNADRTAQLIPEFDAGAKSASAVLIEPVGELQDLMDKKGQQIEQEKGHGQVVLSVTEIMFNVIALVLKGIKALIFHLPASAAGFDQIDHIVLGDLNVGHPAVMVGAFGADKEAVLKEIDAVGILCTV